MKGKNHKGENYFTNSLELWDYLDAICRILKTNLQVDGKSHNVIDILLSESFNAIWEVEPNNSDNKHSKNEFKGIYAFASVDAEYVDFKYIGISQTIRRRFSGHTKSPRKSDASWAYLMAKHNKFPEISRLPKYEIKKLEKQIPDFQNEIIYPLRFTFCPIDDNMLLHIAEVYCVNKLEAEWNSFETH